eukprot:gene14770-biopygen11858
MMRLTSSGVEATGDTTLVGPSYSSADLFQTDDNLSGWHPKIIAVKLDNDFQPGDELNDIVRESTCICWTDETNFDTNFAKVKEEINARFDRTNPSSRDPACSKESIWKPKIIAVKLDNDFQPGDELDKIVRESTCICWTDETNFETNFAKVKEEIYAEFDRTNPSSRDSACSKEQNCNRFYNGIKPTTFIFSKAQWLMDEVE